MAKQRSRGFGFVVKVAALVLVALAVVVIAGDDETRAALIARLKGGPPGS